MVQAAHWKRRKFSFVNEDKTEVALMLFACLIPGSLLIPYSVIARNTVRIFAKRGEGESEEWRPNWKCELPLALVLCVLLCVPLLTGCLPLHH